MGVKNEEGKDQEAPEGDPTEEREESPEPDDSEDADSSEDEGDEDEGDGDEASDDDSEDSGEEPEGREKPKTPNFFDPKKLDPKLKPVWNAMQASFTRHVQKARLVVKKAAAWDELVQRPDFREWIEGIRGSRSQAQNGAQRKRSSSTNGDTDSIRALIREELRPFHEERAEARKTQARREFKRFKQRNPDWALYQDQMDELMERNPNLTFRQALKLAREEGEEEPSREDRDVMRRKKKSANTSQPGGSSVDKKKQVKEIGSIFDAFDEAKADLSRRK